MDAKLETMKERLAARNIIDDIVQENEDNLHEMTRNGTVSV